MQVQTIDKEDKVDRGLNELRVIDRVHDEVIQLHDRELEFLFRIKIICINYTISCCWGTTGMMCILTYIEFGGSGIFENP